MNSAETLRPTADGGDLRLSARAEQPGLQGLDGRRVGAAWLLNNVIAARAVERLTGETDKSPAINEIVDERCPADAHTLAQQSCLKHQLKVIER